MKFKVVHIEAPLNGGKPLYTMTAARIKDDGTLCGDDELLRITSRDVATLPFSNLADSGKNFTISITPEAS